MAVVIPSNHLAHAGELTMVDNFPTTGELMGRAGTPCSMEVNCGASTPPPGLALYSRILIAGTDMHSQFVICAACHHTSMMLKTTVHSLSKTEKGYAHPRR